jgi:excisionase family DNA binding protein
MADLLTTSQVQDKLRVDRTTIYRMVEDGRLPAIRVGKQWRFQEDEIERWLQARGSSPPAPLGNSLIPAATAAPVSVSSSAAPAGSAPSPATTHLSEILPIPCVQLIQDAFAEMLGVMLVITDLEGRPVTQVSHPCGYFMAATQKVGIATACAQTWQGLAETVSLEPHFIPSEIGLLCARALIRLRSELKGMVVMGGIAPETWPPSQAQIAATARELNVEPAILQANLSAVYQMDRTQSERALRFIQRIADVFSHIAEDRALIVGRLQAIALLTSV